MAARRVRKRKGKGQRAGEVDHTAFHFSRPCHLTSYLLPERFSLPLVPTSSYTQPVGDVAWTCSRPTSLTFTPTDIIRVHIRSEAPTCKVLLTLPDRALALSVRTSPRACAPSSSRALGKPVIATATPTLLNSRPR